ncbi:hypothetical protein [Paenibacillus algorifonticola]|uniref:YphA family membrane protein n=1 Tax=Paenibacillus algorifonticola TaxID=684063 RepID=UPI000945334A|nr:hypothetical protein [Paenibacillus algorifonticola]
MNEGYLSFWIMIMAFILMMTGWAEYVGAGRSKLIVAVLCLFSQPFHYRVTVYGTAIEIYASVMVAAVAVCWTLRRGADGESRRYLLLCACLTGIILGGIQKLYRLDPVFYWIDPVSDGGLLGGLLVSAFSMKPGHQFGILLLAAVLAELANGLLSTGIYMARIGSLAWWDSFWLAFAYARIISIVFQLLRASYSKVAGAGWRNKGGSSPK